jgi:hypothetical protein
MRGRTLLAVLLGVLLPLPLAWLLHILMFARGTDESLPRDKTLVPMLSPEERRGLLTYGRHCDTNADCEAPLQCFFNTRLMSRYCSDSKCMTDVQCPEGFVCRTQTTTGNGDALRVCSLTGVRREGEACLVNTDSTDYACEKGLLCQGRCGRPCNMSAPTSCPEGFFCHAGSEDGPSCLPTCEGRGCPEGQQCVVRDKPRLQGRQVSRCARVYGHDCRQHPCAQGQKCVLDDNPRVPDAVWMECLSTCGEGAPPCPEGTVCHQYRCHTSCEPEEPSSCAPGFTCHRKTAREPWRCVPTPRASRQPSP